MKSVKQSVGGSSKAAVEIKTGSIVSAVLKNKGGLWLKKKKKSDARI